MVTLQAKGKKGKKHEDTDEEDEEEATKPAAKAKAGADVWSKYLFACECTPHDKQRLGNHAIMESTGRTSADNRPRRRERRARSTRKQMRRMRKRRQSQRQKPRLVKTFGANTCWSSSVRQNGSGFVSDHAIGDSCGPRQLMFWRAAREDLSFSKLQDVVHPLPNVDWHVREFIRTRADDRGSRASEPYLRPPQLPPMALPSYPP